MVWIIGLETDDFKNQKNRTVMIISNTRGH